MQDVRIAVVQMTCLVGDAEGNIARMEQFLNDAATDRVDLVCFPELSVHGYTAGDSGASTPEPIPGPSTEALAGIARRLGITFLAGLLEEDVSGIVYNTQVVFGPQGTVGSYRKTHVPTSEIGTWSCGSDIPAFEHPKVHYGIEICYDAHFPEVSTILAERGAEILFMPHSSGVGSSAADKKTGWLRFIPARALDNTVYVAVCNQVGDNGAGKIFSGGSFICNPRGEVIAESSTTSEEIVVADLKGGDLAKARAFADGFFRHFRRPEIYDRDFRTGHNA